MRIAFACHKSSRIVVPVEAEIHENILNDPCVFVSYDSVESVPQAIMEHPKGKSIFTNVTEELLTIVLKIELDADSDGIVDKPYMSVFRSLTKS